jgi:hypothetical protein
MNDGLRRFYGLLLNSTIHQRIRVNGFPSDGVDVQVCVDCPDGHQRHVCSGGQTVLGNLLQAP